MTLLASGRRNGYLLKSRVSDVDEFLDAVGRVSRGGSVVDPALVQELVAARDVEDPLEELTRRERDVLALMAEGRSNAGIGRRLWITEGTVEKHVHSILTKLQLAVIDESARTIRRDWSRIPVANTLTPAMFSGTVLAAFALARTAGRTQLEAMVMRRAKLRKVDALLERRGFLAMLAARLMPGVAATGLHYALDRSRPHVGTSEDEARSSRATAASTARVVIDRHDG